MNRQPANFEIQSLIQSIRQGVTGAGLEVSIRHLYPTGVPVMDMVHIISSVCDEEYGVVTGKSKKKEILSDLNRAIEKLEEIKYDLEN